MTEKSNFSCTNPGSLRLGTKYLGRRDSPRNKVGFGKKESLCNSFTYKKKAAIIRRAQFYDHKMPAHVESYSYGEYVNQTRFLLF